ncbi:MAG: dTDP-4-dehydrorhamnose 3,5-epimerase [Gammaproteobacteria bacterium]|nr:dTDP-4-dehydrorhamnose 3,5-epimerase [Gammaproteobacteria bacterium]MBU1653384.1 dTDP-4-dehydrorhamnose 3,5-epimerase [Gammaproteobacteria bacterium]MBU1960837.1 dTDP-4-dehydrorhamnose 3,5-epimerase [Gammaproteobacteria bacterium]
MRIEPGELPGLRIVRPARHGDSRGWFMETWRQESYAELGSGAVFVQDNLAKSEQGVLRGLHIQHPHGQGKLVQVFTGRVFDVAVDVRRGSPTFGRHEAVILDAEEPVQFYIPPGFAHGYYVMSEEAIFGYKCTDYYHPETQFAVRWDDPALGIDWPLIGEPLLSAKDRAAPLLAEIPPERLPAFIE